MMEQRILLNLQVGARCDQECEPCARYFDCTSPLKKEIYRSPILDRIEKRMSKIRYKIAVMSGKGGVGKSTVTGNLAIALRLLDANVGILDSDFYGPTMPKIMGLEGKRMIATDEGMIPLVSKTGIKLASVASTQRGGECITWLGDDLRWALYHFLGNTQWDELDFLLIDLPSGLGEETLNMMKTIKGLNGAILVTIPPEISRMVVEKCISLCRRCHCHIFGLIENMGPLICPNCSHSIDVFASGRGKATAEATGVPFLGTIPLDRGISRASDEGIPYGIEHPHTPAAKIFKRIAEVLAKKVGFA